MIEFFADIAAFAIKSLWLVIMFGLLGLIIALLSRQKAEDDEPLELVSLNDRYEQTEIQLKQAILSKKALKIFEKSHKQAEKQRAKDPTANDRKRIYVLAFNGDIAASSVESLAREITALLSIIRPKIDEVVLKLMSPGGTITGYGQAAAELLRLKHYEIPLTVCVDQVAASGGYLMAVTANEILAAPFAVVGSIGVVAQVPNIHRLLKKHDIDYREVTAGEYKRTVSLFGEITDDGMTHFRGKLDTMHEAFKSFVAEQRPQVNLNEVGTGDFWSGRQALELKLIDALSTSEQYLTSRLADCELFALKAPERKSLLQKILKSIGAQTFWQKCQMYWSKVYQPLV